MGLGQRRARGLGLPEGQAALAGGEDEHLEVLQEALVHAVEDLLGAAFASARGW